MFDTFKTLLYWPAKDCSEPSSFKADDLTANTSDLLKCCKISLIFFVLESCINFIKLSAEIATPLGTFRPASINFFSPKAFPPYSEFT